MARLERRILEELIYERVRLTVDLCDLMAFEADLASSIERALRRCARTPEERTALAQRYMGRAWQRVAADVLRRLDGGTDGRDEPEDLDGANDSV